MYLTAIYKVNENYEKDILDQYTTFIEKYQEKVKLENYPSLQTFKLYEFKPKKANEEIN
jgi:hypothetical protein